ncbi:MAG: hypothetical protein HC787_09580 [Nostocaceae cyanobacterium CSU_2_110]|nr:hypothetical protein [Nostocaceae cyanobacterium CSU_2_110]
MPKTITGNDPYRKKFQEIYGNVRNSQWLNIRTELRSAGLKLDMKTVEFFANFKKLQPRTILTKEALSKLDVFTVKYSFTSVTGSELSTLIRSTTNLSNSAIYKSFYKAQLSFSRIGSIALMKRIE